MGTDDRLVGVIGGMGPDATIDFMAKVVEKTPARCDQDHVRMIVEHNPRIPSRQLAMQGAGDDPGPVIAEMAERLEKGGADFIVMPCNSAHAWQNDAVSATSIPFISIIEESVAKALQCAPDDGAVGLLTTPGCFAAGLYQRAFSDVERQLVLQSPEELADAMSFIDRIKASDKSERVVAGMRSLAENLLSRGATTLIAACTEIPLVLNDSMFSVPLISSTDVLAEKTVALALLHEPIPNR